MNAERIIKKLQDLPSIFIWQFTVCHRDYYFQD